jgi:amino acid transporter
MSVLSPVRERLEPAGSSATEPRGLRTESIGLPQVLFQSITHMGPAAAIASSLLVGFTFAGATMPLSIVLAMGVCLLIAVSVGQMAKHIRSAGGLYVYVAEGLGERAGAFVGWLYLGVEPLIPPIILMVLGQIVGNVFAQSLGLSIPWWVFTILAAGLTLVLNVRDVRVSTNAGLVLGTIEIVIFGAFAIYLIGRAGAHNTASVFDPTGVPGGSWSGMFKGMVFSILAFQGFETAAPMAEEARDARRTIPRAVFLSTIAIGIFYVVCVYAAVLGWGITRMGSYATNPDPWHVMASHFWGLGWVLIFFAVVNSALANGNAGVAAATRGVFALGRAHMLPASFGDVHPVHRTPHVAVVAQTGFTVVSALVLGALMGATNGFSLLATVATILVIAIYMLVCVASIAYFWRKRRREFNLFLHVVCPVAATAVLFAPLYYQFFPLPSYPVRWANWVALAWLVVGIPLSGVMLTRQRRAGALSLLESGVGEPSVDAER